MTLLFGLVIGLIIGGCFGMLLGALFGSRGYDRMQRELQDSHDQQMIQEFILQDGKDTP